VRINVAHRSGVAVGSFSAKWDTQLQLSVSGIMGM
jgi:hypothetical protein